MKTKKDKRGLHKRNGELCGNFFEGKDERKERRRLFKSVRHKLLMHIPLTEEEEAFREMYDIDEHTQMTNDGKSRKIKIGI